jgi:hypothetical protein
MKVFAEKLPSFFDPCPLLRTQKIFGSMPCPNIFLQVSWLLTSPLVAQSMGSKDADNFLFRLERMTNQVLWFFTNPYAQVYRFNPFLTKIICPA